MKPIWIVVANNTLARIFTLELPTFTELNEIEDMTHVVGRRHDRDITNDLPGNITSVAGGGHDYEPSTDPKKMQLTILPIDWQSVWKQPTLPMPTKIWR